MYMEPNTQSFNSSIFTQETKNICICTATSIMIIILFIISPLSNFFKTSLFMKTISGILLMYVLFLNYRQTNILKSASDISESEAVKAQLNVNILCSYVFSFFIGLLIIFIFKNIVMSFF
jgi:hypothetical protein